MRQCKVYPFSFRFYCSELQESRAKNSSQQTNYVLSHFFFHVPGSSVRAPKPRPLPKRARSPGRGRFRQTLWTLYRKRRKRHKFIYSDSRCVTVLYCIILFLRVEEFSYLFIYLFIYLSIDWFAKTERLYLSKPMQKHSVLYILLCSTCFNNSLLWLLFSLICVWGLFGAVFLSRHWFIFYELRKKRRRSQTHIYLLFF